MMYFVKFLSFLQGRQLLWLPTYSAHKSLLKNEFKEFAIVSEFFPFSEGKQKQFS